MAVSRGTQMQMQGAMSMERGFARILGAGADPTTKAALFQSARDKGAMAAKAINDRYYRKEMEQVNDAEFQPAIDDLRSFAEAQMALLETGTIPIPVRVPYEQANEMAANAQAQHNAMVPDQVQKGAEGAADTIVPPQPAQALPANEMMDSVEAPEVLAFVNLPEPFAVASPAGISHAQKIQGAVGQAYTAASQKIMNIAAKYGGNPFIAQFAESMMDNLVKQSNMAITGSGDPQEAQEWMENREREELEQVRLRQDEEKATFDRKEREAKIKAASRQADELGIFGDDPFEKAAGLSLLQQNQKDLLTRRKQAGVAYIPDAELGISQNWDSWIMNNDRGHAKKYSAAFADIVNNQAVEFGAIGDEEQKRETLKKLGALEADIDVYLETGTVGPTIQLAFERMANSSGAQQEANERAVLLGKAEIYRRQPEMAEVLDAEIGDFVTDMLQTGEIEGPEARVMLADKFRTHQWMLSGRKHNPAPQVWDRDTKMEVYRATVAKNEAEASRQVLSQAPAQQFGPQTGGASGGWDEPTGPLRTGPFTLAAGKNIGPRPVFDPSNIPPGSSFRMEQGKFMQRLEAWEASRVQESGDPHYIGPGLSYRGEQRRRGMMKEAALAQLANSRTTGSMNVLDIMASTKAFTPGASTIGEEESIVPVLGKKIRTRDSQRREGRVARRGR